MYRVMLLAAAAVALQAASGFASHCHRSHNSCGYQPSCYTSSCWQPSCYSAPSYQTSCYSQSYCQPSCYTQSYCQPSCYTGYQSGCYGYQSYQTGCYNNCYQTSGCYNGCYQTSGFYNGCCQPGGIVTGGTPTDPGKTDPMKNPAVKDDETTGKNSPEELEEILKIYGYKKDDEKAKEIVDFWTNNNAGAWKEYYTKTKAMKDQDDGNDSDMSIAPPDVVRTLGKTATIVMVLPVNAILTVNGQAVPGVNGRYSFKTTPLTSTTNVDYRVQATIVNGGRTSTLSMNVSVLPGRESTVRLVP